MCGRFVITASGDMIADVFNLDVIPRVEPSYNIAPTQAILAVRKELREFSNTLEADWFSWGLVPAWAKDPNIAFKTINARAESARILPAFRDAFKYRRCVVPATGYFEWKDSGTGKSIPYYITRSDGGLILMAGLWEYWLDPGGSEIMSTTILTRDSGKSPEISPVHHRMPMILQTDDFPVWYAEAPPAQAAFREMAERSIDGMFETWPVSDLVNKASNEGPSLIRRMRVLQQGELF